MRLPLFLFAPVLTLALAGCGAEWKAVDVDGDGFTASQGDCDEGASGSGAFPGAVETWYDGVDSDCDGRDDFDKDGDGFVSAAHGGDDCWDDDEDPAAPRTVSGATALRAADVFPGALDNWYDGVDQDCGGEDDFDQDGDGFRSSVMPDVDGNLGDDCWDDVDDARPDVTTCEADGSGDQLTPADVYPGATDAPLDGVDAGCDGDDSGVEFDADGDSYAFCAECDDTNAAIYPNPAVPEEWYDGIDQNCDGNDGDQDGDGVLSVEVGGTDCWDDPNVIPAGYDAVNGEDQPGAADVYPGAVERWYDGVDSDCAGDDDFDQDADGQRIRTERDRDGAFGIDCDDTAAGVYVGAAEVWYDDVDQDCDGNDDDQDGDGYIAADHGGNDCNDTNNLINPGVAEQCDRLDTDENCNGLADNADTVTVATAGSFARYRDADGDGFGVPAPTYFCDEPGSAYSTLNTDCLDTGTGAASTFPGAAERESSTAACRSDVDGDGYGASSPVSGVSAGTDCVDSSAAIYPTATETAADGTDSDCNASEQCYRDADGDSYRTNTLVSVTVTAGSTSVCSSGGYAPSTMSATDCVDSNSAINPGASETAADGTDSDCNASEQCYQDADGDSYRTTTLTAYTVTAGATGVCSTSGRAPSSMSTTDCVDSNSAINPGATETAADGTDSNCDASEQCYQDADGDSYRTTTLSAYSVTAGGTGQCTGSGKAPSSMPSTDCVDSDSAINPGATETAADGTDSDCNASEQCYQDADGDSYRTATLTAYTVTAGATGVCSTSGRAPSSMSATDCVDGNSAINPGATETAADGTDSNCDASEQCYQDADGDSYRTATLSTYTVTRGGTAQCTGSGRAPSGMSATDCVDGTASINPGASETAADGIDSNCDASEQCYQDADGDSYRTATLASYTVTAGGTGQCTGSGKAPSTMSATDCLDTNANAFPGAAETQSSTTCMEDADADGYGDESPPAGVTAGSDCNDGNASISPGDPEVCDSANTDEDCDGNADDYDSITVSTSGSVGRYTDADLDGYGTGTIAYYCDPATSGLSATAGDCNDGNDAISPGDPEICDASNTDEDCDGRADDSDTGGATGKTTWYRDADSDTQGTSATTSSACDQPSGYVSNANDCNDSSAYVYQGAPELCDGLNNGCSGGSAASGWSAATSEDGVVSKVTSAGVWSNVSITGTSSAPTTVALDGSTYHVCEGTYYARMSVNANTTPTVQARSGSGSTFVLSTGTAVGPTLTVDATTGRSSTRATLTGVTIEGGSAGTGSSGSDLGAGIYVATATGTSAPSATHLTMTNVTIRDGVAAYGGGLALVGMAAASGSNVTFRENLAIERGGGVYASGTSTLTCSTCAFTDNMADNVSNPADTDADGAGICGDGNVTFTISSSTFSGNVADDNGGAGFLFNGAQLTLTGSTVELNEARTGGAFHLRQTLANTVTTSVASLATARASYLNLLNSDLALNIASDDGGAVYVDRSSVLGCTGTVGASYNHGFDTNEAGRGGAIFVSQLDYTKEVFDTCDFTGNNATVASSGEDLAVLDGASLNYTADALGLNYSDTCEKTGSNYQCN